MENWWCDFSNSYFDMFTTYILAYCFSLVQCACGKYMRRTMHSRFFVPHLKLHFFFSSACHTASVSSSSSSSLPMYAYQYKMRSSRSITKWNRLLEYKITLLYLLVAFSCHSALIFLSFPFSLHHFSHEARIAFAPLLLVPLLLWWLLLLFEPFLAYEVIFHAEISMFARCNSEWILGCTHIERGRNYEFPWFWFEMHSDCVVCSRLHRIESPACDSIAR